MKTLYLQIAIAVTSLGTAGGGLAYMQAAGERNRLKEQVAHYEGQGKDRPGLAKAAPAVKPAGRDFEKEVNELATRVRGLENDNKRIALENKRLLEENDMLRRSIATAQGGPGPKGVPTPGGAPEPIVDASGVVHGPAANLIPPAPPPPPDPNHQPWDSEMDELANVCKLSPEQKEQVRTIIMESQAEFERKLIAASQKTDGQRDMTELEALGEEISKRTQERIRQIMYPEQQQLFRDLMRKKEEAR